MLHHSSSQVLRLSSRGMCVDPTFIAPGRRHLQSVFSIQSAATIRIFVRQPLEVARDIHVSGTARSGVMYKDCTISIAG